MRTLLQESLSTRPRRPLLIGVVHLLPCPGSPRFSGDFSQVLEAAEADARALQEGGADGLIVENFGDMPFFRDAVPPETVASMAQAVGRLQGLVGSLPVGVNVLRNDARAGLGLCALGASFLRINVHSGAMLTDQGLIQGRAAETVRERQRLAPGAAILADVHVKHAVPLGEQSLLEAARDAFRRGAADALVISGAQTGAEPEAGHLRQVREGLPEAALLIGSGLSLGNAAQLLPWVQGAIVGTSLKHEGRVEAPVETRRVRELVELFHAASAH